MAIAKVNIEASAHQQLRELVQRLADEYGLIVLRASIDWLECGRIVEPKAIVTGIDMDTRTRG